MALTNIYSKCGQRSKQSLQTSPSTQLPSTQIPSTQIPSTQIPSTQIPSTQIPSTQLPVQIPTSRTNISSHVVPISNYSPISRPNLVTAQNNTVSSTILSSSLPSPKQVLSTNQSAQLVYSLQSGKSENSITFESFFQNKPIFF